MVGKVAGEPRLLGPGEGVKYAVGVEPGRDPGVGDRSVGERGKAGKQLGDEGMSGCGVQVVEARRVA